MLNQKLKQLTFLVADPLNTTASSSLYKLQRLVQERDYLTAKYLKLKAASKTKLRPIIVQTKKQHKKLPYQKLQSLLRSY